MRLIINFLIGIGRPIWKLLKVVGKIRLLKIKWKYPSLVLVVLTISWGLIWFYLEIIRDLPNVNEIYTPPALSTKIYDRKGKVLYRFYQDENRSWVGIEEIPKELIKATLAIEDKDFYEHHGFSVRGIARSIWFNYFKKNGEDKLRGGSTITQQLAKNVFLNGEKKWKRKIQEAILAILLENKLSKDRILERYFNQVAYGGNTYGIGEAAGKYFGKKVKDLNAAEASFLAGLPAAPSSYSPFSQEGYKLAKSRQKHVLEEMVSLGYLKNEEAEEIYKKELKIKEEDSDILAPHFVFYVKDYLNKLGFDNVERRGLSVISSLDMEIQQKAEKIVKEEVEKNKGLRISNGAALVLDARSGEILAMVGSKDYFAKDIDGKFNVVTQGLRQPGSSIKPINYLLALEKGKNLSDSIEDGPVSYEIAGQKNYVPQNYNGKYMGTVSLKTALASSLNIPSVKLLKENGVENMIRLGQKMGINTWQEEERYGLSLALGAGEVKMIEMAGAYNIFANLGEKIEINPVLEVKNYLGEKVYQKEAEKEEVVEAKYCYLINEALSDNDARAPIFGTNSLLKIEGKKVAVKTGTTNNLRDNWCIGWTPSYLVAVWVGNNNNSPMSWVASGVSGATPIWNRIMKELLANKEKEEWAMPEGITPTIEVGTSKVTLLSGNNDQVQEMRN